MTLYPLGSTSVNDLFEMAKELINDFDVARNVNGVEVRPPGIDKGIGAQRVAAILGMSLEAMAGVGDSDPDLSYLTRVGFSAAPHNATDAVRQAVTYVSQKPFGAGLLEIVTLVERHNRKQILTET